MKKYRRAWMVFAALLVLAGCGLLGSLSLRSFDQRLSCAYGKQTAVIHFTDTAYRADRILREDLDELMGLTVTAKRILDSASRAGTRGDISRAEKRLELALSLLDQVQKFVALPNSTTRACRTPFPMSG